jgi:hypothetical protein
MVMGDDTPERDETFNAKPRSLATTFGSPKAACAAFGSIGPASETLTVTVDIPVEDATGTGGPAFGAPGPASGGLTARVDNGADTEAGAKRICDLAAGEMNRSDEEQLDRMVIAAAAKRC